MRYVPKFTELIIIIDTINLFFLMYTYLSHYYLLKVYAQDPVLDSAE